MISSPGPRPRTRNISQSASVPELTPNGFFRVHVTRQVFFKLDQLGAEHITAALQYVKDGLIDFSFQVVVLLHVAIKTDCLIPAWDNLLRKNSLGGAEIDF